MKLDELLKDLIERQIFWEVAGYAWTIEYQKRGLPHVHILLILKNIADKCRTGSHIDRIICAEIPDPNEDKELYDIVKAHMIHGPCGDLNSESPCMKKEKCMGRCCARYPYKLCEETRADRDGYPTYRRRKAAPIIDEIGNKYFNIDSSWVVPYNPYLLKKYDTHINVEIATSVKSFKYIFKYVYKEVTELKLKCTRYLMKMIMKRVSL